MANCENCAQSALHVPYVVHEGEMVRSERNIRRLWVALIVAVVFVFVSNATWLYAWMQYDYTSEEFIVEQDTSDGGNANYIGNDGDIINGVSEGDETETEANP